MGALDRVFRSRRPSQERPLAAIIAGLWKNGEQGLEYDVPGFAASWNQVGPELVVNGDAATGDFTGWLIFDTAPSVTNVYQGTFRMTAASGGSLARLRQSLTLPSKTYRITVTVTDYTGSPGCTLALGRLNSGDVGYGSLSLTGNGTFSTIATVTEGFLGLAFTAGSAGGGSIRLDKISVKEWFGYAANTLFQDSSGTLHAYMPGQGLIDPPVGLLLDKRLGLPYGPPLAVPDFTTGGWTKSASVTAFTALSFTTSGIGGASKAVNNYFGIGKFYELVVSFSKSDATTSFTIVNVDSAGASAPVIVSSVAASGTLVGRWFAASSGGVYFRLGGAASVTITSIVVREIPGNHAYQTTTTSRPTLSARYNLLAATEDFTTGWTAVASSVTANAGAAPDGTLTADRMTRTANYWYLWQAPQVSAGVSYRLSIWIKSATGSAYTFKLFGDGANQLSPTLTANANWQRFEFVFTNGTAGVRQVGVFYPSPTADCDLLIWGADLRAANDGIGLPPYQRVVDANTYDTAGFPLYLRFDGVDDWLQTASIDFSGTDKVFIAAAACKLSDSIAAVLCELSASKNANTGVFALLAPGMSTSPDVTLASKGSYERLASKSGIPAPSSFVVSGIGDIFGDTLNLRLNGTFGASNFGDQGIGNFGNYPLYIGRRAGASLPFTGRLYSLLIRGAATSDATITKVERYLNQKARIY